MKKFREFLENLIFFIFLSWPVDGWWNGKRPKIKRIKEARIFFTSTKEFCKLVFIWRKYGVPPEFGSFIELMDISQRHYEKSAIELLKEFPVAGRTFVMQPWQNNGCSVMNNFKEIKEGIQERSMDKFWVQNWLRPRR